MDIALYAYHYNIQVMFGCASIPGTDRRSMRWRCRISTTIIWRRRRFACGPSRIAT